MKAVRWFWDTLNLWWCPTWMCWDIWKATGLAKHARSNEDVAAAVTYAVAAAVLAALWYWRLRELTDMQEGGPR